MSCYQKYTRGRADPIKPAQTITLERNYLIVKYLCVPPRGWGIFNGGSELLVAPEISSGRGCRGEGAGEGEHSCPLPQALRTLIIILLYHYFLFLSIIQFRFSLCSRRLRRVLLHFALTIDNYRTIHSRLIINYGFLNEVYSSNNDSFPR